VTAFREANVVAGHLNRRAWEAKILPIGPFSMLLWPNYEKHPSSKRIDAGESPASSASFNLPDGVKAAHRPVKPGSVGASPPLAANF
jgi:hypothetical protein